VFHAFFERVEKYPVVVELADDATVFVIDGEPRVMVREPIIDGTEPVSVLLTLQRAAERGLVKSVKKVGAG
jgi:hypothetical protein